MKLEKKNCKRKQSPAVFYLGFLSLSWGKKNDLRKEQKREKKKQGRKKKRTKLRGSAFAQKRSLRSQLKRDNPLNLSILLRGGKETNKDSPSNGE